MLFSGLMDDESEVFRVRPTKVLDRRDVVRDYQNPESRVEVPGAVVQSVQGSESQAGNRDATLSQYSITDTDNGKGFWEDTDAVEIDGVLYQIVGHAQYVPSPTGSLNHWLLLVNRWEG